MRSRLTFQRYAVVLVTINHIVVNFSFLQRNGLACAPEDESNWGYGSFIDTILTDKDDHVVFPEDHIANYYELPGFTGNSPELVLTFTSPLAVNAGQEYRLWYWEDLVNDTEEDNKPGPSCMKVIYLFSD